jgi:hypothetical protein
VRIPDATERKVLLACGAVAGLICAAPGDIVSAGLLWVLTFAFYLVHLKLLRSEGAQSTPANAAPLVTEPLAAGHVAAEPLAETAEGDTTANDEPPVAGGDDPA